MGTLLLNQVGTLAIRGSGFVRDKWGGLRKVFGGLVRKWGPTFGDSPVFFPGATWASGFPLGGTVRGGHLHRGALLK